MPRLHVTQDETGFWQLSLENDDGDLTLLAHQFTTPDHLIQDAHEMVSTGEIPDAVVVVDPPRRAVAESLEGQAIDYKRPAPRKAGA